MGFLRIADETDHVVSDQVECVGEIGVLGRCGEVRKPGDVRIEREVLTLGSTVLDVQVDSYVFGDETAQPSVE